MESGYRWISYSHLGIPNLNTWTSIPNDGFVYSEIIVMVAVGQTSTQVLHAMHLTLVILCDNFGSVRMALTGQLFSHLLHQMHLSMSHITRPRFLSGTCAGLEGYIRVVGRENRFFRVRQSMDTISPVRAANTRIDRGGHHGYICELAPDDYLSQSLKIDYRWRSYLHTLQFWFSSGSYEVIQLSTRGFDTCMRFTTWIPLHWGRDRAIAH